MSELLAISPIDGRYAHLLPELSEFFSEFALLKQRIWVETEYLIALSESRHSKGVVRKLSPREKEFLRSISRDFSLKDAKKVKGYERELRHDVAALVRFLARRLEDSPLKDIAGMVHLGLASEDVNNLAYSMLLKRFLNQAYLSQVLRIAHRLVDLAERLKSVPMLARTHGQPASPTTLGKELAVFAVRVVGCLERISEVELGGKLTGATGNLNALAFLYPKLKWIEFSQEFVRRLGLKPEMLTTQVLPHESVSTLLREIMSLNNVLLDLSRDLWRYASDGYLLLAVERKEVGSTAMPHKVNPIDLERAEGNLELANSLLGLLASKPQVSRLQRDLSDSTVKRNYGVAFAHCLLAYKSLLSGLERLRPNPSKMLEDLEAHPEVLVEAILTTLKGEGKTNAYEVVKRFARGRRLNVKEIRRFVKGLGISPQLRKRLLTLTPARYLGLALRLSTLGIESCRRKLREIEKKLERIKS